MPDDVAMGDRGNRSRYCLTARTRSLIPINATKLVPVALLLEQVVGFALGLDDRGLYEGVEQDTDSEADEK